MANDATDATVSVDQARTDIDAGDVVLEVRTADETRYVAVSPTAAAQLQNELHSTLQQ